MNVTIEQLPKSLTKLTVELAPEELQPYLQAAAGHLSTRVDFPGFRPGKAPYDLVKQRLGEVAIYEEATEEIVKKTYVKAVIEKNIEAIGRPEIKVQKMAPGNPFIFTAEVAVVPAITLGDYKKLKARKKETKIDPDGVKKTLDELRRLRAKEALVDRPAKMGDKVELDVSLFLDGIPVDGGQGKKQQIVIGEKMFVPGFEEKLIGAKAGETKEFQLPYPKEYHQKNLAGRNIDFKVSVKAVYQIDLTELNDEFAQSLGKFKNQSEVEDQIKRNLLEETTLKEQQRFELDMLNEIIEQSTFGELPEVLITAELNRMIEEIRHDLEHQGANLEDYLSHIKKTMDQFREGLQSQAERRIKSALVLRAIREQEKLNVDPTLIEVELGKRKEMYKDDTETYNKIDSPEYRDQLEEMLLNRKVLEFLESHIYPAKA